MANAPTSAAASRYWLAPVSRAVIALAGAGVITFSADHSPSLGLVVFGAFALLSGLAIVLVDAPTARAPRDRTLPAAQGAVGVVAGTLALVFPAGGLGFFLYLVSVWAAVTGALEIYRGLRARERNATARDDAVVGAGTALLALAFVLLPPHPVVSVGLLGAYLVLLGVYLVIAGLSLKWAPADAGRPATPAANESEIP